MVQTGEASRLGPATAQGERLQTSSSILLLARKPPAAQGEDPLDDYIGASDVLQQLRNIVDSCKSEHVQHKVETRASSAPRRSFSVDHSIPNSSFADHRHEVELCWQGSALVWSEGGKIFRTFDFEEEIVSACWTDFELVPDEDDEGGVKNLDEMVRAAMPYEDSQAHRPRKVPPNPEAAIARICTNILHSARPFSPAQRQVTANTVENEHLSAPSTVRTLCVAFRRSLIFHIPGTGIDLTRIRLFFSISGSQVFPSPSGLGLIVVRAEEQEDKDISEHFKERSQQRSAGDDADAFKDMMQPLPTVLYLRRPYDDFSGIECFEDITFGDASSPSSAAPHVHGETSPLSTLDERLVLLHNPMATTWQGSPLPQILVTADPRAHKVRIYIYVDSRVPLRNEPRLATRISGSSLSGTNAQQSTDHKHVRAGQSTQPSVPTVGIESVGPEGALSRNLPPRKSARLERRASGRGGVSVDGGGRTYSLAAGRARRSSAMQGAQRARNPPGRLDDGSLHGRGPSYDLGARRHIDGQPEDDHDEEVAQMVEDLARRSPDGEDVLMGGPPTQPLVAPSASSTAHNSRSLRPSHGRQSSASNIRSRMSSRQSAGPTPRPRISSHKSERAEIINFEGQHRVTSATSEERASRSEDIPDVRFVADDEDEGITGSKEFGRAWAAVALLEEIDVVELNSNERASQISAFGYSVDASAASVSNGPSLALPLLYIVLPFVSTILCREIRAIPAPTAILRDGRYTYESAHPPADRSAETIRARTAVPVFASGQQYSDILMLGVDGQLSLSLGPLGISPLVEISTTRKDNERQQSGFANVDVEMEFESPFVDLIDARDNRVTAVRANNHQDALTLDIAPTCARTKKSLQAFDCFLDVSIAKSLRQSWIRKNLGRQSAPFVLGDWEVLRGCLLGDETVHTQLDPLRAMMLSSTHQRHAYDTALSGLRSVKPPANAIAPMFHPVLDTDALTMIMYVIHALAQEASLDLVTRHNNLEAYAKLCVDLANKIGAQGWADYWSRLKGCPSWTLSGAPPTNSPSVSPPDLYDLLGSALLVPAAASLPAETSLSLFPAVPSAPSPTIQKTFFRRASALFDLFNSLGALQGTFDGTAGRRLLRVFFNVGVDGAAIDRLPLALALPLKEVLRQCQLIAPSNWCAEEYELIDRMDLAKQIFLATTGKSQLGPFKVESPLLRALPPSIPFDQLSAQLFSKDYRLRDAVKMMRTDIPQIISRPDYHKLDLHQREKARQCMAERTKATTVGRGILRLASVPFNPTSRRTAPAVNLDTRENRNAAPVTFTVKDLNELEWPEFHSGVSSALEIAPGSCYIDSHWIFSHFYDEPNAHHAGFLVGLGLLGHLRSVSRVHAMRYFRPRHNLVTIGFSLGLAASSAGTGSVEARKLFSTQIAAFLPEGSASLNLPTAVQSAGMMAMGVVFLGSNHQWTAERLLQQIGAPEIETADAQITDREGYSLSAGFALGLTMLGKARRKGMRSRSDRQIVEQLRILIHGPPTTMFDNEKPASEWRLDTNTTSVPATLALGLIYLRSGNPDAVDIITLPQSADELDHIRPDQLMFRVIARALILWTSIEPTEAWIMSILPKFLRVPLRLSKDQPGILAFSGRCQLAWINMTAGACLALALRAAGTGNTTARNTLFHFHRYYTVQARVNCTAYFPKLRQAAFSVAADVVMSAMGIVMAGTGDLSTMRLMRVVHARVDQQSNYGSYMATHMAMGMLFLGGGRFTLGRSDSAIAALLIAFYPHFPLTSSDNREHLQAYRHLWALAIEPRVVVAQDVDTNKLCFVPVEVEYVGKNIKPYDETLPCLVGEFGRLKRIRTTSSNFWPAELDLRSNPRHAMALLNNRTLFVKRKKRFGADDDAAPTPAFVSDDALDATLSSVPGSSQELSELVNSLDLAMHHGAFFEHLAAPSAVESGNHSFRRTCANILAECLTLDKSNMISICMALALLKSEWAAPGADVLRAPQTALQHREIIVALRFYDHAKLLLAGDSINGGDRQTVIDSALLEKTLQLMREHVRSALFPVTAMRPVLTKLRRYLHSVGGTKVATTPDQMADLIEAGRIAALLKVPPWDHLCVLRRLHDETALWLWQKARRQSVSSSKAPEDWTQDTLLHLLQRTLSDGSTLPSLDGNLDFLAHEMAVAWKGNWHEEGSSNTQA